MFAYCANNPVNCSDQSGCRPIWERNYGNGLIEYTDAGTGRPVSVIVIYNADDGWVSASKSSGQEMSDAVGGNGYHLVPAETNSFKVLWKSIRSPYLLIQTHGGTNRVLTVPSFSIAVDDCLALPRNRSIKLVVITACSTGGDNDGSMNIAQAFSTRISEDGFVLCSTTNVSGSGFPFTAKYGGQWVVYQNGNLVPNMTFPVEITTRDIANAFCN